MDTVTTPAGSRHVTRPAMVVDSEAAVLARALRHLLRRDGDFPAVWRSSRFGAAVEAHRRRAGGRRAGVAGRTAGPDGFAQAVARLATDPAAVALAIDHLEGGLGHQLPAWPDVLHAGELVRPSEVEIRTWFG